MKPCKLAAWTAAVAVVCTAPPALAMNLVVVGEDGSNYMAVDTDSVQAAGGFKRAWVYENADDGGEAYQDEFDCAGSFRALSRINIDRSGSSAEDPGMEPSDWVSLPPDSTGARIAQVVCTGYSAQYLRYSDWLSLRNRYAR